MCGELHPHLPDKHGPDKHTVHFLLQSVAVIFVPRLGVNVLLHRRRSHDVRHESGKSLPERRLGEEAHADFTAANDAVMRDAHGEEMLFVLGLLRSFELVIEYFEEHMRPALKPVRGCSESSLPAT